MLMLYESQKTSHPKDLEKERILSLNENCFQLDILEILRMLI